VEAVPTNFNPQQADTSGNASTILAPTTGGAVRITRNGGWIVDPDYATSVKVTNTSPLTVAVKLNPRAVWQAGSAISAKDMVAFWKAQNGSNKDFKIASTIGYEDIAAVKMKGTFAYDVVFKKATGDWPLYVYPRLPASASSSAKSFNAAFRTKAPPSNGPFVVTSIDATTGTITENPNPRWWGSKPLVRKIVWHTATPLVQARAFVSGELDAVNVDAATYGTVKGTGTIQRAAGLEWTQLTLNGARGPLKNVDVRRAVAYAINRDEIARRSAADVGAVGSRLGSFILVPGQLGYRDSWSKIAFDPVKSRALLAKAGYQKGADGMVSRKGKPLTLTMPVAAGTPTNIGRSRRIAADLRQIGIGVKLKTVPADRFFDGYIVPLDFDLVTFTWRGSAFPVAAAEPLFFPVDAGQNFTGLGNDKTGAAWDKAKSALDDSKRFDQVHAIDQKLLDNVPIVPLAVNPIVVATRKGLVNYGAAQFEQPDWTIVGFAKKK